MKNHPKGKYKRFHQFALLERGRVNTAVIDFLKKDIFQVENETIEKFEKGKYAEIPDFIKSLEKEGLILELDEQTWIPGISLETGSVHEEVPLVLEIEAGVDLELIYKKFQGINVSRIVYYGKETPGKILPFVDITRKDKDFEECVQYTRVDGDFTGIEENAYGFNKKYNSCWGQKVAVKKDGKVSPCIHSRVVVGDLKKDDAETLVEKLEKYWKITKDHVEKCKDCELRYACFDCREIAWRAGGHLLAAPPHCQYDPYKGTWSG